MVIFSCQGVMLHMHGSCCNLVGGGGGGDIRMLRLVFNLDM